MQPNTNNQKQYLPGRRSAGEVLFRIISYCCPVSGLCVCNLFFVLADLTRLGVGFLPQPPRSTGCCDAQGGPTALGLLPVRN